MLILGNPDTERHTCDIHSQFIVILCLLQYILSFRFPPIHGWESLIVVNFYDCNYQNVNMYVSQNRNYFLFTYQLFICGRR